MGLGDEMGKFDMDKMKESLSGLERFANRHLVETLTWGAFVLSIFSAWSGLFIGTLGWCLLFLIAGVGVGVFFPRNVDHVLKKIYSFSGSSKQLTPIVAEVIKIIVALFLPFIYLGFAGVMAGTAFEYYIHDSKKHRDQA